MDRMKTILQILCAIMALTPLCASAQNTNLGNTYIKRHSQPTDPQTPQQTKEKQDIKTLMRNMDEHGVFNRLEIAANAGTTGLGLEVASPVTKWAKLRVGFDVMPKFKVPMKFEINSYLSDGVNNNFGKIQELMRKFTGLEMDETVEMDSRPTLNTFKMLVDVYPFKNRHWHVTAGFYIGGRSMGKSINTMQEMPSLVTLNMYNTLYNNVMAEDFIEKVIDEPIFGDVYLSPDVAFELQDRLGEYGELGVHIGDYKDGTPYMMKPDKDGTVSAKAYVNRFRPYLGFGYEGNLSPDGKWQIGFEAGAQFWGGVPKVTTHEGVVLNDLKDLRDKVKTYMNLMKCLPVYPSITCRLSYTF